MKKRLLVLGMMILSLGSVTMAKEGMWIPLLLQQYNATDLENAGLKFL